MKFGPGSKYFSVLKEKTNLGYIVGEKYGGPRVSADLHGGSRFPGSVHGGLLGREPKPAKGKTAVLQNGDESYSPEFLLPRFVALLDSALASIFGLCLRDLPCRSICDPSNRTVGGRLCPSPR